jgi:hypothetical protein
LCVSTTSLAISHANLRIKVKRWKSYESLK